MKTYLMLIPVLMLFGCQSEPKITESPTEEPIVNWVSQAKKAQSFESFSHALVSLMQTGQSDEITQFYKVLTENGEQITDKRMTNSRVNIPAGLCPEPGEDWIFLSDRLEQVNRYVVNFRIEENSNLFWCALVIERGPTGFFIRDQLNYEMNLSLSKAITSYEALKEFDAVRKGRTAPKIGISDFLIDDMSLSDLDSLIISRGLNAQNELLLGVRGRLIEKPISEETLGQYRQYLLVDSEPKGWALQRFYLSLGEQKTDTEILASARTFSEFTGDRVWPLIFGARVSRAYDNLEQSKRLLEQATLRDPLNDLSYFALMKVYAELERYQDSMQVLSLLQSRFDFDIDSDFFIGQEAYSGFIGSDLFKQWQTEEKQ